MGGLWDKGKEGKHGEEKKERKAAMDDDELSSGEQTVHTGAGATLHIVWGRQEHRVRLGSW